MNRPQEIIVLETTETRGNGEKDNPYRLIQIYWIKNNQGVYVKWFEFDTHYVSVEGTFNYAGAKELRC